MYRSLRDTPWPRWCCFPHITYSAFWTLGLISVGEAGLFPQHFMFKHRTNIESEMDTTVNHICMFGLLHVLLWQIKAQFNSLKLQIACSATGRRVPEFAIFIYRMWHCCSARLWSALSLCWLVSVNQRWRTAHVYFSEMCSSRHLDEVICVYRRCTYQV